MAINVGRNNLRQNSLIDSFNVSLRY